MLTLTKTPRPVPTHAQERAALLQSDRRAAAARVAHAAWVTAQIAAQGGSPSADKLERELDM